MTVRYNLPTTQSEQNALLVMSCDFKLGVAGADKYKFQSKKSYKWALQHIGMGP